MVSAKQRAWRKKFAAMARSGKFRKKSTRKGQKRKTARRAYVGLTKRVRRKSNKPKKKRVTVAKKSLKSRIFGGTLGKVALGIGAGSLAGLATSYVMPQATAFAKPIAAYVAAGPIGLISELVIDQGLLGQIGGFLGFGGPVGMVAEQERGGL